MPGCDKMAVMTGYAPDALSYVTCVLAGVLKSSSAVLADAFETAIAEARVTTINVFFIAFIFTFSINFTVFGLRMMLKPFQKSRSFRTTSGILKPLRLKQ